MMSLTILGNNSAIPAYGRNPTAQVLELDDEAFLIDCGEGTQLQMARFKIKRSRISHIFISHLHGDHYFGLIGLLTSMSMLKRTQPLHLHGPAILEEIVHLQLKAADTELSYPLYFHPLGHEGCISDTHKMQVFCFRTKHRIDCWGFLFREKKKPRKVDPDRARAYEIPSAYFEKLQEGLDYKTKKGTIIPNDQVTFANNRARTYAFCADTLFDPELCSKIQGADLLYHETTYLKDLEERAAERFHSTTVQAAEIAKRAQVKELLIGHFSAKYEQLDPFLEETQAIFPNTQLALEGACYVIKSD